MEKIFFNKDSKFSPYHLAKFIVDGIVYHSIVQYITSYKCRLFDDISLYDKVMKTQNPFEIEMLYTKIKNVDDKKWEEVQDELMFEANDAKYCQNKELRQDLLDTNNSELIYLSDSIHWGIGNNPEIINASRDTWGKNVLGVILMDLRKTFEYMARRDSL
jgi:ribA/ribD-fused uncharacterized protein